MKSEHAITQVFGFYEQYGTADYLRSAGCSERLAKLVEYHVQAKHRHVPVLELQRLKAMAARLLAA